MSDDSDFLNRIKLTRRQLLKQAAVAAGGVALGSGGVLVRANSAAGTPTLLGPQGALALSGPTPTFTASVLRPADMLTLLFKFYNLNLVGTNLVRVNADETAYIVVHLAHGADYTPQNIAEEAFFEKDDHLQNPDDPPTDDPLKAPGSLSALLAGPSWLAFKVPDSVNSIPYTMNELLAWWKYEQSVVYAAQPPEPGQGASALPEIDSNLPVPPPPTLIYPPGPTQTNIETPYRLVLSPNKYAYWAHRKTPFTAPATDRTELWHTRLGCRYTDKYGNLVLDERDLTLRALRAVWSPDYTDNPDEAPQKNDPSAFRMSLTANDRYQLVRLTSDYSIPRYTPQPVHVNRFMLSALGAWMDTRGFWQPPGGVLDISEWRHKGTMARDHYVRVVYLGYLCPLGHPAALIKVTERKFQPVPASAGSLAGNPAAYLRQRFFIVCRQPELTYPRVGQPHDGRQWPFKKVRITTLVTPNLDDPNDPDHDFMNEGQDAFWPYVNGQPFNFHIVAEDCDGQQTEFAAPLAFMSLGNAEDAWKMLILTTQYGNLDENKDKRERPLDGQRVAFAPSSKAENKPGGKPGDTSVEVKTLTLGATISDPPDAVLPPDQPRFYPIWTEAAVRLSAVEQAKGKALSDPAVIQPHPDFVQDGFGPGNPAELFVKMKNQLPLSFSDGSADRSGGVITPNMNIGGVGRKGGPVGGDVTTLPAQFDPASFFSDAKILGGILLSEIIQPAAFDAVAGDGTPKAPRITSTTIYPDDGNTAMAPQAIETRVSFKPDLQQDQLHIFDPTSDGATMLVKATFRTPLDSPGEEPSYEIVGDLRNFRVKLIGDDPATNFITLRFNRLTYTAKTGKKPNVEVDIKKVEFGGFLKFVNTLKQYLQSGGGGPSIDVTPSGITAGVTLPIPTIGVGIISIQNIAFGFALNIPFSGNPVRARFSFSEREDPFLVTVMALGGGGFFAIAVGTDGVELIEFSLEVGASLALDIGVAEGEVHALAGFYFSLETEGDQETTTFQCYIRLGGSLDVLGIVSVSVEFYLGLNYESDGDHNRLWGQATLTVEVDVLVFSGSVDLTVERTIAGSDSPAEASAYFRPVGLAAPMLQDGANTPGHFGDLVSMDDWGHYAEAFAPVPAA